MFTMKATCGFRPLVLRDNSLTTDKAIITITPQVQHPYVHYEGYVWIQTAGAT